MAVTRSAPMLSFTQAQQDKLGKLLTWPANEPGGAAAVLLGGEMAFSRYSGLASLEHQVPITQQTRFHICSISKTFGGAASALLAQQGRLDLDADVRDYVPELSPNFRITVRQLLNMTSGLRDSIDSMMTRGVWYRYPRSDQDLLDLAYAQTTLQFEPGSRFCYTNINYSLIGLIIERLTGQAFDAFLGEVFWTPLGMTDTQLRDSNTLSVPRLADPYIKSAPDWLRGIWSFGLSAAGGLVSTVADLAKWRNAFRPNGLNAPLLLTMNQVGVLSGGAPTYYGLGFGARPHRGVTLQGHSGGLPGYRTIFTQVPELDLGFLLCCNRTDVDAYKIAREVVDICLDYAPRPARTSGDMGDIKALGGRYVDRASGEVLTLVSDLETGGFKGAKLDSALALAPVGAGEFRDDSTNFTSILSVVPAGSSRPALRLDFGGQVGLFEPLEAYEMEPKAADALVGEYENADMRSGAEVFWRDGRLMLRFGLAFHGEAEVELEAVAPDIFAARYSRPWATHGYAVRFERRGASDLRMFVSSTLVKDTAFLKVSSPRHGGTAR